MNYSLGENELTNVLIKLLMKASEYNYLSERHSLMFWGGVFCAIIICEVIVFAIEF